MYHFLLLSIFAFVAGSCCSNSEPIVELPLGKVLGKSEGGYFSFTNIPYAEPPTGSRRFEAPVPYNKSWTEIRDGSGPAKICIKFDEGQAFTGVEDCLFMHIFTPSFNCEKYYPVHLYIHSGGYMIGSPINTDPSILAGNGMVVVTMGYRLGPLGFLSTGDTIISGNNGMKDQRLAIKWTKDNIKSFCGDPNQILLSGSSAGGASAHLHMLQKSTERYVNAVVSQNGVTTCPWAFVTKPLEVSKRFAEQINCSISSSSSLKACLQDKSIEELRDASKRLFYFRGNPFTMFAPVVEAPGGEDPFLTEHPEAIMKSGRTANIPWLVVYAEREGSCTASEFMALDKSGELEIGILNQRWMELAPFLLFYNDTKEAADRDEYSVYLKDKYLGERKFSEDTYRSLEDMYSDVLFKDEIEKVFELHRKYCPGPVYVLYYMYPHKYGLGNLLSSREDISFGADHMADTLFTLPLRWIKPKSMSEREKKLSQNLIGMYKSMASSGIPTFAGYSIPVSTPIEEWRLIIEEKSFSIYSSRAEKNANCINYE